MNNLSLTESETLSGIEKKELANEDDEENFATNFAIMRRLAGFLTGEQLIRFREVCQDWYDWSNIWFRQKHSPVILSSWGDIISFTSFLKECQGRPNPFTRITIDGYRNEICPGSIRALFKLIGKDIRVLSLAKSRIYHLTEEAAFAAEENGTGPPPEPWDLHHNEAKHLQLTPNLTHLEIGIGYFPTLYIAPGSTPHLPFLTSLQLNFDHEELEGVQESYIENFIKENLGIRRIHLHQADSTILPMVERCWRPGLSLDLSLTVLEPDVDHFRNLLGKVTLYGLSLRKISPLNFGPETIKVLQCQVGALEKLSLRLDAAPFGIPVELASGSPVWFPDFPKLESLSLGVHDHCWLKEGVQFPMLPMREGQFPRLKSLEADAQLGFPSYAHREMDKLETLKLWSYKVHVPFSFYVPNLKSLTIPNFQNYEVQSRALRHILLGGFSKLEILDLNLLLHGYPVTVNGKPFNSPPNPEIWSIFTGGANPRGIKKILKLEGPSEEAAGKGLEQLKALRHLSLVWCGNEGLKAILFMSVTGKLHRLCRIRCRIHDVAPPPKLERALKRFHDRVKVTTWNMDGLL